MVIMSSFSFLLELYKTNAVSLQNTKVIIFGNLRFTYFSKFFNSEHRKIGPHKTVSWTSNNEDTQINYVKDLL